MSETKRFRLSDEERMLADSARAFVADKMPVKALRALRDTHVPEGFDRNVWNEMVALGWSGIAISERYGGAGLGVRGLALVLEEMGKTLGAAPLASTALVAALTIERFAEPKTAERLLPSIASGTCIIAFAVDENAQPLRDAPDATLDENGLLSGAKRFVADAIGADLFLVAVRVRNKPALALVRADAPGVSIKRLDTIDGRGLADVDFRQAETEAVIVGTSARNPIAHAQDCARVALASEMLGASSAAFEITLDYLRTRRQFGQLIGSFQALQHRAAKLFIETELTRSCVMAAADALHRDTEDRALLTSLAKVSAGDLMRLTAYEMIQMHGGIGMTDAHDAGLYLKRGRVAALLHGDSAFHANRYATLKRY